MSSALTVKPITTKKGKGRLPLGHEMFPQLASSIYISAGTKSGKTTLISHILEHCVGESTKVFIFSPTIYIDKTYKHILEQLTKRKIQHWEYPHFIDENGENILELIVNELIDNSKHKKEKGEDNEKKIIGHKIINGEIIREYEEKPQQLAKEKKAKEKEEAKKEKAKKEPSYFFIFDDLGEEMRHKSIYKWLLKQRQFMAKTILSSQAINNLMPNSIGQLDYILIFGGQREDAIVKLKNKLDLPVSDEDFLSLYRYATGEKYHFLYIDRREVLFRKDFKTPISITNEETI